MAKKRTPYETLDVPKSADVDTIKKAHRRKARETHPDRGGNKEEFEEVQKAFNLLTDDSRRKRFDETGDESEPKREQLLQTLTRILSTVIHGVVVSGKDPERMDLVKLMLDFLRPEIAECKKKIAELEKAEKAISKILKRLKDPKGLLMMPLENDLRNIAAGKHEAEDQIKHLEEVRSHLKQCGYDVLKETNASSATITFMFKG